MSSGFIERHLHRLGDRVSIALIKIYGEQKLSDKNVVRLVLPVIRDAFSYPHLVATEPTGSPA